jgi:hypothetical protein
MLELVLEEMFKQKFIVTIATATAAAVLVLSPRHHAKHSICTSKTVIYNWR